MAKERAEELLQKQKEEEEIKKKKEATQNKFKVFKTGVGKYINPETTKRYKSFFLDFKIIYIFLVKIVKLLNHQRKRRKRLIHLILTIGKQNVKFLLLR